MNMFDLWIQCQSGREDICALKDLRSQDTTMKTIREKEIRYEIFNRFRKKLKKSFGSIICEIGN
jgi:hypothetical protein